MKEVLLDILNGKHGRLFAWIVAFDLFVLTLNGLLAIILRILK